MPADLVVHEVGEDSSAKPRVGGTPRPVIQVPLVAEAEGAGLRAARDLLAVCVRDQPPRFPDARKVVGHLCVYALARDVMSHCRMVVDVDDYIVVTNFARLCAVSEGTASTNDGARGLRQLAQLLADVVLTGKQTLICCRSRPLRISRHRGQVLRYRDSDHFLRANSAFRLVPL